MNKSLTSHNTDWKLVIVLLLLTFICLGVIFFDLNRQNIQSKEIKEGIEKTVHEAYEQGYAAGKEDAKEDREEKVSHISWIGIWDEAKVSTESRIGE